MCSADRTWRGGEGRRRWFSPIYGVILPGLAVLDDCSLANLADNDLHGAGVRALSGGTVGQSQCLATVSPILSTRL